MHEVARDDDVTVGVRGQGGATVAWAEPGSARREPSPTLIDRYGEGGAHGGTMWFPHAKRWAASYSPGGLRPEYHRR